MNHQQPQFSFSAPASIMLTGEHAVVYGHPAIVCAVDCRLRVNVSQRHDNNLSIISSLGNYFAPINALVRDNKLRHVLAVVENLNIKQGVNLEIISAINPNYGLGSSAAVTVASYAALASLQAARPSLEILHANTLKIIRNLQGRGSGADLAAAIYGGIIGYQIDPFKIIKLPITLQMSLRYSGYKTATGVVLAKIAAAMQQNPQYYSDIYAQMGATASATIDAMQSQDHRQIAKLLNNYQQLMSALGVSDDKLAALICAAMRHKDTVAAKISGSGLGDCIVAFGATPPRDHWAVAISCEGVVDEQAKKNY